MGKTTDISAYWNGVAVSLASDTPLAPGCRGFYVGVAGDVKVDYVGGGTGIALKAATVGEHPHQISKIYSTVNGTTATDIVALY